MGQIAVAQAVAKLLEKMGTEVFFGVNGHGNWALLDALVHETGIRGVPARAGPRRADGGRVLAHAAFCAVSRCDHECRSRQHEYCARDCHRLL